MYSKMRLVKIMRVPRFIVRPIGQFIADVLKDDRYRTDYGVLYMVHPRDSIKWMLRYLGN